MMAPANGLGRGGAACRVRSHLDACVFGRRVPYCGVLVSSDEVSHAAVCVVTCPPYGLPHVPAKSNGGPPGRPAGEPRDDLGAQDLFLETTQAAFMRSVQQAKEQAA